MFLVWIAVVRAAGSEHMHSDFSSMDIGTCFRQRNYISCIFKRTGHLLGCADLGSNSRWSYRPSSRTRSEDNLLRRHLLEPFAVSSYGVFPRGPRQPSSQPPVASSLKLDDAKTWLGWYVEWGVVRRVAASGEDGE